MTHSASSESQVLKSFLTKFDVNAKKVLEVGGIIDENLIKNLNVQWTSVDPLYTPLKRYELVSSGKSLTKIQHIKDDITKPLFQPAEFDYIFSCNAFHHISDLKVAFNNFHKWLNEGGVLYSHFGPIWSGPDGCHMEAFEHEGTIYNFWEYKLVPFWSHLYFNYEEMFNFLKQYYSIDLSQKLVQMIYKSKWINRFAFSDYKSLLNDKMWEIIDFSYSEGIDYLPENPLAFVDCSREKEFFNSISSRKDENFTARDLLIVIKKRL